MLKLHIIWVYFLLYIVRILNLLVLPVQWIIHFLPYNFVNMWYIVKINYLKRFFFSEFTYFLYISLFFFIVFFFKLILFLIVFVGGVGYFFLYSLRLFKNQSFTIVNSIFILFGFSIYYFWFISKNLLKLFFFSLLYILCRIRYIIFLIIFFYFFMDLKLISVFFYNLYIHLPLEFLFYIFESLESWYILDFWGWLYQPWDYNINIV